MIRNLNALVNARNRAQVLSLLILLVTSTGIFLPIEVALNRIWRFPDNRSYLGNQAIALGAGLWLWHTGATVDWADCKQCPAAENFDVRPRVSSGPAAGILDHEGFRHRRQHREV